MKELQNRTIGEIVAENYRTARVFRKYDLDFCCGGGRTVSEACSKKGIDLSEVLNDLSILDTNDESVFTDRYADWEPKFLIDYIVNNHHRYVRDRIPEIQSYADKVAKVHGRSYPENVKIRDLFDRLSRHMLSHMEKEEEILFPLIEELTGNRDQESTGTGDTTEKTEKVMKLMVEEHEEAGSAMEQIRKLSNDFTPPESACTTYRVLYSCLRDYREDLHKHVHLENNILFARVRSQLGLRLN